VTRDAPGAAPPPGGGREAAAPPLIEARGVSIEFHTNGRRVLAVDRVSFDVRRGEKFVLLGPSGCGKSTLLKAVAGFVRPTAGVLRFEGEAARGPAIDRILVFQEFDQLLPWRTVAGNVRFALAAAGRFSREECDRRAARYLAMVGLEGFADAFPHTLSGGMKQRVALARALAVDPDVLLMDEPFGSLDALTRLRMQREVNRIWRETGKTILFVTHSIGEALVIGHRIMVMGPRPGRALAVLDNPDAGGASGGAASLALAQRIRALLGVDAAEGAPDA
jgi:NitT/TauT family transport system ATP-binding protein